MLPHESPDPVIQQMHALYAGLAKKIAVLDEQLHIYANKTRAAPLPGPVISALNHYDMLDEQDCGCFICSDWHIRRSEFVQAAKLIRKGHKWTVCGCPDCRFVGRIQLNFLAATNRRDLLIEMAFHARYHSNHGEAVMVWMADELRKPGYTYNWWAQEMGRFPMERWIQRCETAISGAISGTVFCNSTMITNMNAPMRSSLNADVSGFDDYFD